MDRLSLLPRTGIRRSLALVALIVPLLIAAAASPQPTDAATIAAGTLAVPRPDGMTVGLAGTNDPQLFTNAQPFEVASVAVFDVPSQTWRSYVPGARAFANSLTTANLQPESIVFTKRTSSSTLVSSPVPLGGAPLIEFVLDD